MAAYAGVDRSRVRPYRDQATHRTHAHAATGLVHLAELRFIADRRRSVRASLSSGAYPSEPYTAPWS